MKSDIHKDLAAINEIQEKLRAFKKTYGIININVDYIQIDHTFIKNFAPIKDWKLNLYPDPFYNEYIINIDGIEIIALTTKKEIDKIKEN